MTPLDSTITVCELAFSRSQPDSSVCSGYSSLIKIDLYWYVAWVRGPQVYQLALDHYVLPYLSSIYLYLLAIVISQLDRRIWPLSKKGQAIFALTYLALLPMKLFPWVLMLLMSVLILLNRWALKQEDFRNMGQWKNSTISNPEWNKRALSWPVNDDETWNTVYNI